MDTKREENSILSDQQQVSLTFQQMEEDLPEMKKGTGTDGWVRKWTRGTEKMKNTSLLMGKG